METEIDTEPLKTISYEECPVPRVDARAIFISAQTLSPDTKSVLVADLSRTQAFPDMYEANKIAFPLDCKNGLL